MFEDTLNHVLQKERIQHNEYRKEMEAKLMEAGEIIVEYYNRDNILEIIEVDGDLHKRADIFLEYLFQK
ncbi:MAG: hypothetical protein LBG52_05860 [Candidatus Peribacteria bacterium]|jgi:hypothetical protein|nr:hypothetical protein [Candidatus Peribacteria bacterium]